MSFIILKKKKIVIRLLLIMWMQGSVGMSGMDTEKKNVCVRAHSHEAQVWDYEAVSESEISHRLPEFHSAFYFPSALFRPTQDFPVIWLVRVHSPTSQPLLRTEAHKPARTFGVHRRPKKKPLGSGFPLLFFAPVDAVQAGHGAQKRRVISSREA